MYSDLSFGRISSVWSDRSHTCWADLELLARISSVWLKLFQGQTSEIEPNFGDLNVFFITKYYIDLHTRKTSEFQEQNKRDRAKRTRFADEIVV